MCLAVLGLDAHPLFILVIAANRDEHYERPSAPAQWWPEGWLAGRDLDAGGTWLGVDPQGRWALLTNVREPQRRTSAPTRGLLVTGVLADARAPHDALAALAPTVDAYNGFNLLAGVRARGAWLSNRANQIAEHAAASNDHATGRHGVHAIGPGTHAISNAALDTPWLKVVNTRRRFDEWCARGEADPEPLFTALASREQADDDALPSTGLPVERERLLSAPFVVTPEYGTRCSTIVLMHRDGSAYFEERSFTRGGTPSGVVRHRFELR